MGSVRFSFFLSNAGIGTGNVLLQILGNIRRQSSCGRNVSSDPATKTTKYQFKSEIEGTEILMLAFNTQVYYIMRLNN